MLHERGWLASHWPPEYGGPGWTTAQAHIFDEEVSLAYAPRVVPFGVSMLGRSEEHTSELQSLMRISYAVFCLKKKKHKMSNTHESNKHILKYKHSTSQTVSHIISTQTN